MVQAGSHETADQRRLHGAQPPWRRRGGGHRRSHQEGGADGGERQTAAERLDAEVQGEQVAERDEDRAAEQESELARPASGAPDRVESAPHRRQHLVDEQATEPGDGQAHEDQHHRDAGAHDEPVRVRKVDRAERVVARPPEEQDQERQVSQQAGNGVESHAGHGDRTVQTLFLEEPGVQCHTTDRRRRQRAGEGGTDLCGEERTQG